MSKKAVLITIGLIVGFIITIGGTCFASYVSAVNYAAGAEQQIKAVHTNNKNVLAQYVQKVQEAAQVPAMARDDLEKIVKAAISGRYGEKGSQATMQWIKEQNPNVDPKLYTKIQQIVEAGRDEFKNSQSKLIDVKRSYETNLAYFWRGMWLRVAGYPKINLNDYNIVTNDYTEDAFKKGKESGPVKLR